MVGVLARPTSSGLADGIRDGLAGVTADVRDVTVEAPYRGAAVDAARMLEAGVRVIVTDLPSRVLRRLAPLCRQYGAALVAVGTGSLEVPDPLDGVVHVTEQRWDAAFELGDWAARHLDGRLFQVVAAPEAEYDVVDALARGHRGAGGEVSRLRHHPRRRHRLRRRGRGHGRPDVRRGHRRGARHRPCRRDRAGRAPYLR